MKTRTPELTPEILPRWKDYAALFRDEFQRRRRRRRLGGLGGLPSRRGGSGFVLPRRGHSRDGGLRRTTALGGARRLWARSPPEPLAMDGRFGPTADYRASLWNVPIVMVKSSTRS